MSDVTYVLIKEKRKILSLLKYCIQNFVLKSGIQFHIMVIEVEEGNETQMNEFRVILAVLLII